MFIKGEKVYLRPLVSDDAGPIWLSWLNDPEVLKYRGPKGYPSTLSDIHRYLGNQNGDIRLAIMAPAPPAAIPGGVGTVRAVQIGLENQFNSLKFKHIGNITLGSINFIHRSAEINIMIGDRSAWGVGYGGDAVGALTKHAFENMALSRVWAESPNPAFNAMVRKLGWCFEGLKRSAFFCGGGLISLECWACLKVEERPGELISVEHLPIGRPVVLGPRAYQESGQGREAARRMRTIPISSGPPRSIPPSRT